MESYEDFTRRHSRSHREELPPSPRLTPPSLIVFRGVCVLPPQLSVQQREEMRRLREAAVSVMKRREEECVVRSAPDTLHQTTRDDVISTPTSGYGTHDSRANETGSDVITGGGTSLQNLLLKSQAQRLQRMQCERSRPRRSWRVELRRAWPTPPSPSSASRSSSSRIPVSRRSHGEGVWRRDQVSQLEVNLSDLRTLISELEDTLSLADRGQEVSTGVQRRLLVNHTEVKGQAEGCVAPPPEWQVERLLQEERRRRQEVLQGVVLEYGCVSSSCPGGGGGGVSRLEDTSTSVVCSSELRDAPRFSGECLPLLAALVKGFLTRRLLHTEHLSQLARTIRDSQLVLQSLRDSSGREEVMLQQRVYIQLQTSRLQLHDFLFSSTSCERMRLIQRDREMKKQRLQRLKDGRVMLSAATRKSLDRKFTAATRSGDRKSTPPSQKRWRMLPERHVTRCLLLR